MPSPSVRAAGNIKVASFVKLNSGQSDTVVQATSSSDVLFGISQSASDQAPLPNATTSLCAVSGEPLQVWIAEQITYLQAGTAGWTAGDLLGPDASGLGKTVTSSAYVGAQGLSTVTSGELGPVVVRFMKI